YVREDNFYSALTTADTTRPVKNTDSLTSRDTLPTDTIPAKRADTIPVKQNKDSLFRTNADSSLIDTLPGRDSLLRRDSVVTDTFSLKLSKDSLDAPVYYEAEDSAVVHMKDEK